MTLSVLSGKRRGAARHEIEQTINMLCLYGIGGPMSMFTVAGQFRHRERKSFLTNDVT